ncbi:hypothetical protein SAMN04488700_1623 [Carnobacterium iners]|uniref:YolD-like protein n=1 Tax=Carnobacterium iners TaxID=1073423 RepID=A0A1X7N901_9LACT|nr:hypothetical protein [Carnobacterium iners]SEL35203.1 hypothetical protein SAMN04488114_1586 [Carnobacterium iners]SMH34042.1 hypothetical protein SAMN04488700_1623 [Carnobacterium iners]
MDNKTNENNTIINPITSGYVDRGMAKWQGLILSEHNEVVNEEKKMSKKINIEKPKQSLEEISKIIDYSYRQKAVVTIQLDYLINGKYDDDILGVVYGYYENNIYIQSINAGIIFCELDLIRNVGKVDLSMSNVEYEGRVI